MQDIDQLPLEQWANQLKLARESAAIELSTLSQDLMLSVAQLRSIEAGSLKMFHGPGYYLRAVEKYAKRLDITLDPPVTELTLTDSQIALKRVKNTPSASSLAKNQSNLLGAHAMPRAMRRSRIGLWLGVVLLLLVGTGTWMAIQEGWPNGDETSLAQNEASQNNLQANAPTPSLQTERSPLDSTTSEAPTTGTGALSTLVENQTSVVLEREQGLTTSPDGVAIAMATAESASELTPEPAPELATEPAPPPPDVIEALFSADCWVEIRRVDGSTEQGIYKPAQTLTVDVSDIDRLTFGNAQAVSATRAGEVFDIMAFTRGGNNVARIPGAELNP